MRAEGLSGDKFEVLRILLHPKFSMLPVSLNGFLCVIRDPSESIAHELGHE